MKRAIELENNAYPDHVFKGIKESLKQAEQEQLTQYTGIENMLNLESDKIIDIENCSDEPSIT